MKVAIIYNEPIAGVPDSENVVDDALHVAGAIEKLGYDYSKISIGGRGDSCIGLLAELRQYAPSVVFNLIEGFTDEPMLSPIVSSLFEMMGYPYTGSPFYALLTTTDKAVTKAVLYSEGISTPLWQQYRGFIDGITVPPPWIVKPAWEDASVGIDENSFFNDKTLLFERLPEIYLKYKRQPILIESYIDGREFNISVLEQPDGTPKVLPLAEIQFQGWPGNKPKIVDYKAKWAIGSFEYRNTVRVLNPGDAPYEDIKAIALRCWEIFNLKGYGRVDIRMDKDGNIFVLEVNANPCISPDAGFISAAREAGYEMEDVIRIIIEVACNGTRSESRATR